MGKIRSIALGFFLLILGYLMLNNPNGVAAVFTGSKGLSVDEIKALQGR